MGSLQDANPRVSSAPIARSRKPWRLDARGHPDDKRTLVSHSLVDGRSSQAGATPFVVASKSIILDALGAKTSIAISRLAEGGYRVV